MGVVHVAHVVAQLVPAHVAYLAAAGQLFAHVLHYATPTTRNLKDGSMKKLKKCGKSLSNYSYLIQ